MVWPAVLSMTIESKLHRQHRDSHSAAGHIWHYTALEFFSIFASDHTDDLQALVAGQSCECTSGHLHVGQNDEAFLLWIVHHRSYFG